jgi:TPR repeat protein
MIQVADKLKAMINYYQTNDIQLLKIETKQKIYTHIIQNFDKINIKEIEPTVQNICEGIFEEDLSFVIDKLIDIYFKEINEGKEENVRKQNVLGYFNKCKINLQEVYNWLLNNQNNSNSIYLLGYFKYHGIVTDINRQEAFELYKKAGALENHVAQFHLVYLYKTGEVCDKDYNIAFELSKKLAEKGYLGGLNLLGYCYCSGIGTDIDMQKSFDLYQKAADLGNPKAQYNLAVMYEDGGFVKNDLKAFKLSKKSAESGYSGGIMMLGYCYQCGIGVYVDKQKAFELYQEAANLGNSIAQYNLAMMYHYGNGIEENTNKAIYWYKKSASQGFHGAQNKLNELLKDVPE